MAAELQLLELPIIGINRATTSISATKAAVPSAITADANIAATATATTTTANLPTPLDHAGPPPQAPKRQRRPSVRLGEFGVQTAAYDSHVRRAKPQHPWTRLPRESSKSIKARSVTNLVNGGSNDNNQEFQDTAVNAHNGDVNANLEVFGHRKKAKRGTVKRVRSNWASSKIDEGGGDNNNINNINNVNSNGREDEGDETFREFDLDSDQSPVHSVDNVANFDWGHRRQVSGGRGRILTNDTVWEIDNDSNHDDDVEDRKWEGVRTWLIDLGLSRYAPVFEVHEVDDEVLPMLTLEDLKDMGINAVGSRRKLYSAIQKLRKGFSTFGLPCKAWRRAHVMVTIVNMHTESLSEVRQSEDVLSISSCSESKPSITELILDRSGNSFTIY